jgi:hypothetical protein
VAEGALSLIPLRTRPVVAVIRRSAAARGQIA